MDNQIIRQLEHFGRVQQYGGNRFRSPCPVCSKSEHDTTLSTTITPQGKLLLFCHRCQEPFNALRQALHLDRPTIQDLPPARALQNWPNQTQRAYLEHRWQRAWELKENDRVWQYLEFRGLRPPTELEQVRLLYNQPHIDELGVRSAPYDCMIARIVNLEGQLVGLHHTYLSKKHAGKAEVQPSRKIFSGIEASGYSGGAVQLSPHIGDTLAIAEGIETALAVQQMLGCPVWSCLSTGGMRKIQLPPTLKELVIACDHDAKGYGKDAACALIARVKRPGLKIHILKPPEVGDWLDVLNQGGFDHEQTF